MLRAITLPSGLLICGAAGAALVLSRLGAPPEEVDRAGLRLARPLLAILAVATLPIAVVETLLETNAPLDLNFFTDLLPYMLRVTLFGPMLAVHLLLLALLAFRSRAGHPPGIVGSTALLLAWPQLAHLTPLYAVTDPDTLTELSWLGIHRVGAALWLGSLAVLLLWSRRGGPAERPWGGAFFRLSIPAAALLIAGAAGTLLQHGGLETLLGPSVFDHLVQIKVALLLALLALGSVHFLHFRRQSSLPPTGSLRLEIALALTAVLLGALLGLLPSPA